MIWSGQDVTHDEVVKTRCFERSKGTIQVHASSITGPYESNEENHEIFNPNKGKGALLAPKEKMGWQSKF